jgi:hypothetical protein
MIPLLYLFKIFFLWIPSYYPNPLSYEISLKHLTDSSSLVLILHDLIETLIEVSEDLVKVGRVEKYVMKV